MNLIKTVLVDDHQLFIEGLEKLLNASNHFQVINKFHKGQLFVENSNTIDADLLILDIEMPDLNGLDIIRRVRLRNTSVKILILSMHSEGVYSQEAYNEGANGYLTKSIESSELINYILRIVKGENIFLKSSDSARKPEKGVLSKQEMKILKIIASGKTSTEIAFDLNVSYLTIKAHRRNMMRKLGANNSAELITIAMEKGIL